MTSGITENSLVIPLFVSLKEKYILQLHPKEGSVFPEKKKAHIGASHYSGNIHFLINNCPPALCYFF